MTMRELFKRISITRKNRRPRIVWMYWNQGWDVAPEIVRACAASWQTQNPQWDVRLLTEEDIQRILSDDPALRIVANKQLPLDAYSNLVRLGLLLRFGGVWADATTYCLKPLDVWLENVMDSGFFGFARPGPDRMLSSWFLAVDRGCELLPIWQKYCVEYWSVRDERHTHFWFHGALFAQAYEESPVFRGIWDRTPQILAKGPCYLLPHKEKLNLPFGAADREKLVAAGVPLLKLTHKLPRSDWENDSAYRYFAALADEALLPERLAPLDQGKPGEPGRI